MTEPNETSPSQTLKLPLWLRNTVIFPLVFLNLWLLTLAINYVQPLLSIVLVSIILAIVLDFPIKFLQRQGMPRSLSLTLVLLVGIGLVGLLGLLIVPALIQQVRDFIDLLPQWVASADALFEWLDNSPPCAAAEPVWPQPGSDRSPGPTAGYPRPANPEQFFAQPAGGQF